MIRPRRSKNVSRPELRATTLRRVSKYFKSITIKEGFDGVQSLNFKPTVTTGLTADSFTVCKQNRTDELTYKFLFPVISYFFTIFTLRVPLSTVEL